MARPKTPLLSRRSVVEAALALIDAHGLSGWTLRQLATELGVHESSVYYYYRYKSGIFADVLRHVLADFDGSDVGEEQDWKSYLLEAAPRYYRALAAHPNIVGILLQETPRAFGLAREEKTVRILLDAGFPSKYVVAVREQLEAMIIGALQFAKADLFGDVPSDYPNLKSVVADAQSVSPTEQLEIALRAYLDGLEVQLNRWTSELEGAGATHQS